MKICITGDSATSCDRAMDDCVGCVPGGGVNVVEQLTLSEMTEVAWSWYEQVNELSAIMNCLLTLYDRSRLGGTSKMILRDQIRRLHRVESDILYSGNKLFLNLMFQRDQETSHDESEAQTGTDCQ